MLNAECGMMNYFTGGGDVNPSVASRQLPFQGSRVSAPTIFYSAL